jgi:hypothetical protein
VTALWTNAGDAWGLLPPSDFPDEATLHTLVEEAPQLLPLSGAPQLTIVGREVSLGGGYADLVAIESSGRAAIIEVKLARNSEARRAVVAQVLTYAAFLQGTDTATLERDILAAGLHRRGHDTLAGAVAAADQEGTFDAEAFALALEANLASGAFRLVLVLDSAPRELVRLVGYLEAMSENLVIDLVTVAAYDVDGTRIVVPQRVDPERVPAEPVRTLSETKSTTVPTSPGADAFLSAIDQAPKDQRPLLHRLTGWAIELEKEGLVQLRTGHGKNRRWTLLPRIPGEEAGLVTIWNDTAASISLWRSVFERIVPDSIPDVEAALGMRIGTGNVARSVSDEALAALTLAYRNAATRNRAHT